MPNVVLATAGYDHTIKFWEASSGAVYHWVQYPEKQVNCLQITPDKKYIAAGGNPIVKLYDIDSKKKDSLMSYEGHATNVTAVGFQKDAKWMYTGSEDGTIKIWDLRAAGCQRSYDCGASISSVALHPNQAEVISGDRSGQLCVWDLQANKLLNTLIPEADVPITTTTIACDASLVVAGNSAGHTYFWEPRAPNDYHALKKLRAHGTYILRAQLSPDVRYLATASADRTVKLWSVPDLTPVSTLTDHTRWVWDCVFSADSSYLVTASSDHTAKLWEVTSGDVIRTFTGHSKSVVAVALNDSAVLAAASTASEPELEAKAAAKSGAEE